MGSFRLRSNEDDLNRMNDAKENKRNTKISRPTRYIKRINTSLCSKVSLLLSVPSRGRGLWSSVSERPSASWYSSDTEDMAEKKTNAT